MLIIITDLFYNTNALEPLRLDLKKRMGVITNVLQQEQLQSLPTTISVIVCHTF